MPAQIVMDHTGDTRHEFDADDKAATAAAEERFKELTGAGFTAGKRIGNGQVELLRKFDGNADETIFFPRLQGG